MKFNLAIDRNQAITQDEYLISKSIRYRFKPQDKFIEILIRFIEAQIGISRNFDH